MTTPFERPVLVVASPHAPVGHALRQFISIFLGGALPHHFPEENTLTLTCVEDLHTCFDDGLERRHLFNAVCVLDLTSDYGDRWDIYKDEPGLRPSELVLRYPEVYWIFVVRNEVQKPEELPEDIRACHFVALDSLSEVINLLSRHARGFRTCFDPTGFRRWIRKGEKNHEQRAISSYGIAIDEEVSFALLNGYVLYRNHHATFVVSSLSEMNCVMDDAGGSLGCQAKPDAHVYVMEDIELNFGDATSEDLEKGYLSTTSQYRYSDILTNRKGKYTVLTSPKHRLYVTSAPIRDSGLSKRETIVKPYGGMFDPELRGFRRAADHNEAATIGQPQADNRHGAPGRAQQVADALLVRARRIEREAGTLRRAIHVALLANEARWLLENQTKALSLEALAIQYRMEVTAECAFIGTASQLAVNKRFDKLESHVKGIVSTKNDHQVNNALVEIADDLRQVYRNYDQFIEESEALIRLRKYEWRLKYLPPQLSTGLRGQIERLCSYIKGSLEWYFNFVMGRFWKLVFSMVILITVFALSYWGLSYYGHLEVVSAHKDSFELLDWWLHSAVTFFSLQQGLSGDPKIVACPLSNAPDIFALRDVWAFRLFWGVTVAEIMMGFVHVGILVSYLFQKITRR